MSIKVTGPGISAVDDFIKQMENKDLYIGWFEGNNYTDSTPVASVAAVQEHGSEAKSIPPRPFMQPAMHNNQDEWMQLFGKLADDVILGSLSVESALDIIGATITDDIKGSIKSVNSPALKESTIAGRVRRGLNTTDILQATGVMISTVTWVVE